MGLDPVVLRPEGEGLPAHEQCLPVAVAEDLIDLLVRQSELGQGISRHSAVHPAI